jgi:hypothetical protein
MVDTPSQHQILAFAVYELRLLLSGHLGPDSQAEPSTRVAAHLAYALHNEALAVIEGRQFDPGQAIEAIRRVDTEFGENSLQRLSELTGRAL